MSNQAFNHQNSFSGWPPQLQQQQIPPQPNVAHRHQQQMNGRPPVQTGSRGPFLVDPNESRRGNELEVQASRIVSGTSQDTKLYIQQDKVHDSGAFGVVFIAHCSEKHGETKRKVAIKKIFQDKSFRHRELPMMMKIFKHENHVNVVLPLYYFIRHESDSDSPNEPKILKEYLHLVLEFMPYNVSNLLPTYSRMPRNSQILPLTELTTKVIMYQLFRGLSFIHRYGICHRDIKPNNLLFNPENGVLKICDFGSAKELISTQKNVSYICARYYRAPELLFGVTHYTNAIDLWSAGVVFTELIIGRPVFQSESHLDQLVSIIGKLGTPTREEMHAINSNYTQYELPLLPKTPWNILLQKALFSLSPECLDLIGQLFRYDPTRRILPLHACAHPYFDDLREDGRKWLPNREFPPLFNFSDNELALCQDSAMIKKLRNIKP